MICKQYRGFEGLLVRKFENQAISDILERLKNPGNYFLAGCRKIEADSCGGDHAVILEKFVRFIEFDCQTGFGNGAKEKEEKAAAGEGEGEEEGEEEGEKKGVAGHSD